MRLNDGFFKVVESGELFRPSKAKALLERGHYSALMLVKSNGHPANDQIITHGTKRIVGSFPSCKCGQSFDWQSFNERDRMYAHEADARVHSYVMQPHILYFVLDGRVREYRPDCMIDRDGEPIEVEEVKDASYDPERHPEQMAKYAAVERIYGASGVRFTVKRVLKSSAAHVSQMLAVHEIVRDRWTEVTPEDFRLVRAGLRAVGGCAMMGAVERMLPFSRGVARAKINAMIVRRLLHVKLDRRLSPVTIVSLFDPPPRRSRLMLGETARG